jgi:GT2 family glycosyltransferase
VVEGARQPTGETDRTEASDRVRPPVSVIVPFAGDARATEELVDALRALELASEDELLVIDNSLGGAAVAALDKHTDLRATAVPATAKRSSYYARNVGARAARHEWVLFMDADCRPSRSLLADFLAEPPEAHVGAVAGTVSPLVFGDGLMARHARSRRYLDQARFLAEPRGGFAATAALLVRRRAWEQLGGFCEVRSGADVDFSWRLVDAGYEIELRPSAVVHHRHRETLAALIRQRIAYGAGERWLARRRPDRRSVLQILPSAARRAAAAVKLAARGEREEALFSALDAIAFGAEALGWLAGNAAGAWPAGDGGRRR